MAFVGGLMGPYMRPIPVGASAAMLFSLGAAFIVTPWAAVRLLRASGRATSWARRHGDPTVSPDDGHARHERPRAAAVPRRCCGAARRGHGARALKLVTVKMLPFDNKSEFQVIVDMPEGTALEQTARVSAELAEAALNGRECGQRPELRRRLVAVQLQRPGSALLSPPWAASGRSAGESAAQGRPRRAKPRHRQARARTSRCRSHVGSAPPFRCRKCHQDRRCCRHWSRKCTGPMRRGASSSPAR